MSNSQVARVSPGVPTGGQFAATSHAEPAVSLSSAGLSPEDTGAAGAHPQYRNTVDTRPLERDAEFFGHEIGFNSTTGNLELATGTANYSVMLEFRPDGNIVRTHNGEPVDAFPAGLRKARVLERFAANRQQDLIQAAAGSYVYRPGE